MGSPFQRAGAALLLACESAGFTLALGGGCLARPGAFFRRFREIVKQMFHCGVQSFPVVALVGVFSGMVLSLQAGIQLGEWGQEDKIGIIVAVSMVREMGPIMTAVESRFKASVIVAGGLGLESTQPMVDPFNFLPRVTVPTLMLNGRYDSFFPVQSSILPYFENLGTPEADKKLVVTDANHYVLSYGRNRMTGEILDWLDRYLGVVQ